MINEQLYLNPKLLERHTMIEWQDLYPFIKENITWEEYSKDLVEVVEFCGEFIEISEI